MTEQDAIRQRIKYLVEEGGLYPVEPPATKPLLLRLVGVLVFLETIDLILHFVR